MAARVSGMSAPAATSPFAARQRPALQPLSAGAGAQAINTQPRRMTLDPSKLLLQETGDSRSPSKKRRSQSLGGAGTAAAGIGEEVTAQAMALAAAEATQGGPLIAEISPRKKQRMSLVPRKSILKPPNSTGNIQDFLLLPQAAGNNDQQHTGNFTTTFYAGSHAGSREGSHEDRLESTTIQFTESHDSQNSGEVTLNYTRRQSRRVSFAPSAQMREFTTDIGDDSLSHAGTSPARAQAQPALSSQPPMPVLDISAALAQASASLAVESTGTSPAKSGRRRSSTATGGRNSAGGHRRRSSVANVADMVESLTPSPTPSPNLEQGSFQSAPARAPAAPKQNGEIASNNSTTMEDPDASSMNIADPDSVTTAFKSHFIFPRTSIGAAGLGAGVTAEDADSFDDEEGQGEGASGMVLADEDEGDVTSAFASNTHLFGSMSRSRQSLSFAPPPSSSTQPEADSLPAQSTLRRSSSGNVRSPSKKIRDAEDLACRRGSLPASHASSVLGDIPRAPIFSKSVPAASGGRYSLGTFGPDREVPLGEAGLDADEAAKLRAEKAQRGRMAFYASSSTSTSAAAAAAADGSMTTSLFAVHHSPILTEEQQGAGEAEMEGEGEQSEMDMSMADTRRVSNVFARAFLSHTDEEEEEEEEEDSASKRGDKSSSPAKREGGLYPSLSGLGGSVKGLGLSIGSGRTEGQNALAFLDGNDEEEEEDSWLAGREKENLDAPVGQSTFTVMPDAHAGDGRDASVEDEQLEPEAVQHREPSPAIEEEPQQEDGEQLEEEQNDIEDEDQQIYKPLPDPVFIPRASRLSIVQERPLEEEEVEAEAEDEDDNDGTQDMDVTGVFGNQQQSAAPRRLSIAHPSFTNAPKSPAKIAQASASPGKSRIPRRSSLAPVNSAAAGGSLTPASAPKSPSRAPSISNATGMPSSPVPLQAKGRPSLVSGLTPNMKRLSDWSFIGAGGAGGSAKKAHQAPRASSAALPTSEGAGEFDTESRAQSEPLSLAQQQDIPVISLEQFLNMADMQFMDGLLSVSQGAAVGGKGRKHSAMGAQSQGAGAGNGKDVTLTEQVVASGAVIPMMESLQMMMRELRGSLRENSQIMDDLEEEVEDQQPPLFAEYAAADADTRAMMDQYFNLVRLYFRQETRREWYEYRSSVFDALCSSYATNLSGLQKDLSIVQSTQSQLDASLPSLRTRASEVALELEKEKNRQYTLAEADQEHLADLREALKEQNSALEEYRRDVVESEAALARVQEKEDELSAQAKEARAAIESSRKICDGVKYYTQAEMFRLQDELDLLQYLHGWKLVQFDSTRLELSHRGELACTLLLKAGGRVEDFEVVLLDPEAEGKTAPESELKRHLTSFLADRLQLHLQALSKNLTAKELLRHISSLWSSARKLRSELLLVSLRYPLSISLHNKRSKPGQLLLRAAARIYAITAQSDFSIIFEVTGEEMANTGKNEGVTAHLGVNVEVAYGDVDREELIYIVRERIASLEPKALLEACQEAEAKYT